jgi:myo-inositol-1(or 4)-monophosphatase
MRTGSGAEDEAGANRLSGEAPKRPVDPRAAVWLEFAVSVAVEAGALLADGFQKVERGEVDYKGWRDLVTKYDLASERLVIDRIRANWPGHALLSEEGGGGAGTEPYRWIIDPLDGTTNFVHRHPFFCVSIALEDAEGLLAGVVHAPRLGETFTAIRGGGAMRDRVRPMRVSQEGELGHALMASGFAYRQGEVGNTNLENWSRLSLETRGLRRCGSAALDLAYVADGRYDGYWELALNPWDVAAGALLVQEAGGAITDARGGDDWLYGGSIAASNGLLHSTILSRLSVD